ncbi:valine--tRNA ligase [Rhodovulum adriaticum]|uniref:Valine--tRNA ligase n=1 Tax=Rhodovulum adriaticum TaxID=35804 RepID=A0A4R2NWI0_RHOAD|nr:valine--tRNA ligase [Rhodovulum adriaticum]MBK1635222.1 valine--tRNA ligase [Rhodovulum adriaticum]TCP26357.1 valyl-tRNA synthetase [Rhodovulum adriaticum]
MPMEKTFNAAEAEQRLYDAWESAGCFTAGANAKPGADTFCIMIPPPNVTGSLHMGHAFNNTLQDILVRWHRMRGFDTLWQPGQDHAGIATQMVVERELAKDKSNATRREMGREKFLEKVWEWKQQSGGTIINQLKRLGASCDWSRNAFTMSGAPGAPAGEDGNFHDAVIRVFVEMYNKGLIYRGKRLVNWDPHFETAISDLEVENIEVAGHMWHFKYPLAGGETYTYVEKDEDGNVILEEERDYISIATTRPETMLGDGAVAVHPSDERYAPIVGKLCEIPVGPKEHRRLIPIITDEYPDPNFGSGAVKITGAHDFNDYGVALRNQIPLYVLMDTKGHMRADGKPYAEEAALARAIAEGHQNASSIDTTAVNLVPEKYRGLDRFEARKQVVADITAEGLAVMVPNPKAGEEGEPGLIPFVENKPIMQPFGDRSKVVIEPMLTDQWFVDAAAIVGPALDAVRDGRTQILPERDRKVYFHWLENIEPWCISRQLWWGHQIPVWYDQEGNEYCAASESEAVKMAHSRYAAKRPDQEIQVAVENGGNISVRDHAGREIELVSNVEAGWVADYKSGKPGTLFVELRRDPDVLDTWFSSGLWPIGTLGWPEKTPELEKYFPTDVLITGFDIIFFWVARMMMMQLAVVDQIPFHTVYVHALVRDEKGKKMSKSLGNVLDPLELIDEYGADAVRFTLTAMAAMGRDLKLSTQRIAGYRNFGTKLWNAARFAEMNGVFENDKSDGTVPTPSETVNTWIIGETARVRAEVDEALAAYRFNDAANALYAFVWGKVCDWYVEFSKPLLMDGTPEQQAETRATMAWVIDQCLILLHPIMPYITEELWGTLGQRSKMLVHADWPTYGAELIDADADREMNWVISLIEEVRSARAQMRVPAGAQVPMLYTELDTHGRAAWDRNEALIKRLARIESLDAADALPKGCITIAVEGGTLGLPLAGIIDVAAEKARLEKSLAKLEKELGGLQGRLKNPKFVESAPEDVVEETRDLAAAKSEEADKLRAALARLAELA